MVSHSFDSPPSAGAKFSPSQERLTDNKEFFIMGRKEAIASKPMRRAVAGLRNIRPYIQFFSLQHRPQQGVGGIVFQLEGEKRRVLRQQL